MKERFLARGVLVLGLATAMALLMVPLAGSALNVAPAGASAASSVSIDPAFQRVWQHCDQPVEAGVCARSWMWGPDPVYTTYEAYAEGPGGKHLVTYFDKSRMEINDPAGNSNSEWYVTNGLLVVDMVSGKIQVGNNMFLPVVPANIPVAGDMLASAKAPTYASLARVASLNLDNRAPNRTGQEILEGLGRNGNVGIVDNLSSYARYGVYEPTLGHNIADVFWTFMNQKGITYHDGAYMPNEVVVDWLFAMGYPITEPYWINISVGGQDRWVLMQAFQRRILTYSPANPVGWQVEMGNVGRAYFDWRYNLQGQSPSPTPVPTAVPTPVPTATPRASLTIDPTSGDINTQIMVYGKYFPANSAVNVSLEKASMGYSRRLVTLAARADGSFEVKLTLPVETAQLGDITITAAANSGAVKASQTFHVKYSPAISVSPSEVVVNGSVRAQGGGFPANASVRLDMLYTNGKTEALTSLAVGSDGKFDSAVAISHKSVGTRFRLVASTTSGFKATSTNWITVIAQPVVRVSPSSGLAGVTVTFSGSNWPARRAIRLGLKVANSDLWLPGTITADGQGNFTTPLWIGPQYTPYNEVRLIGYDPISTVRVEALYTIIHPPAPTATPLSHSLAVEPTAAAVGAVAKAAGSRWPVGSTVSITVSYAGVQESVGETHPDGNGNFAHYFVVRTHWLSAGQVTLTAAVAGGPTASTGMWILPAGGRIMPAGLSMEAYSVQYKDGPVTYKVKADGWQAGSAVNIDVVSAGGGINLHVAAATVKADGTFNAAFEENPTWVGRSDIGVRAATTDGRQSSVRYLPFTQMKKIGGTSNSYEATGQNWPGVARLEVVLHMDGQPDEVIGQSMTDPAGNFSLEVTLPKLPENNKNDIEIRAVDQPYCAWLDL